MRQRRPNFMLLREGRQRLLTLALGACTMTVSAALQDADRQRGRGEEAGERQKGVSARQTRR